MQPKLHLLRLPMLLLPFLVMAFSFSTNISIAQTPTATVATDKDDYPPGSTVYITGSGFSPNENVTLQVIHEGETGDNAVSGAHAPWTVSADANGNISAQWTVPLDEDELGATLKLTADGQNSGLHAEAFFTDSGITVTPATVGSLISADNASTNTFIALTGPIFTESSNGDIGTGTITLNAPSGFVFDKDLNHIPVVRITSGDGNSNKNINNVVLNNTIPVTVNAAGTTLTISINSKSSTANTLTWENIWIKPTSGIAPLASGNITISGTSSIKYAITPPPSNYGTLVEVPGALHHFNIGTISSPQTSGNSFNINIVAKDQFENTITNFTNTANISTTIGTITPITSSSFVSGQLTQSVTITGEGTGTISVSSNNKTGTSNAITVNKTTASVSLSNLSATYDGVAHSATATTTALGTSSFSFTYAPIVNNVVGDASSTAPINAGSYQVVATLVNDNYKGFTTGTLIIRQASNTITFTNPGTKTYGDADFNLTASATSGGAVSFEVTSGNATVSGSTVHITGAGDVSIKATQGGNVNYLAADPVSQTFTIKKATATITLSNLTPTYTGSPLAATATTNPSGLKVDLTYDGSTTAPTSAGSYEVSGTINDNNYEGTISGTLKIKKADQTITVTNAAPSSATYNTGFTVAATASSGLPVTYSSVAPLSNTGATYTMTSGTGTGIVKMSQAGDNNYNPAPEVTANVTAVKANQTITWATPTAITYPTALSASQLNATTSGDGELIYSPSLGTILGAGDQTLRVTAKATDNYSETTESVILKVDKGTPAIAWANPTGITYGTALNNTQLNAEANVPGSFTYTPAIGEYLHAGNGQKLSVSFTPTDANNYNTASKDVTIDVAKAKPSIEINGYNDTYDGSAHGATIKTAIGARGEDLSASIKLGSSFTNVPGGAANWSFDGDNDHNPASGSVSIVIAKATPTINLTVGGPYKYSNSEHGVQSATVNGVTINGKPEDLGSATVTYNNSSALPVNANSYNVIASYNGNTNYNAAADQTGTLVIEKADAAVSVTGYSGTYDGNVHGASGSATGVGGVDLKSSLKLGASFTDAPGGIASWAFDGGTNYNDQSGSVEIAIAKATPSITLTVGSALTYDGKTHHVQSAVVTGINNTTLGNAIVEYKKGTAVVTDPIDAGDYAVTATYVATTNYNAATPQTGTLTINKATATISVSPYEVTYDGTAHTSTGTATGVESTPADLSSLLTLSGTTHTNAGTYTGDTWNFAGNDNYEGATGIVNNKINKANAVISVTPYSITYDGNAHTVLGTAKGVKGESLSGLDLSNTTHTDAGSYTTDSWSFTDATGNYNNVASTAIANVINKANATIKVTGYEGVFDNASHSATGTATGVKGENLFGSLSLGASFTVAPGGTANWIFTGGTNYNDATGSVAIRIYAIPSVTLSTPSPVEINKTSIDTAAFSSDVFNPVWVYTNQATGTVTKAASPINNMAQLSLSSATPAVYSVYLTYTDWIGQKTYKTPTVYMVFYDPSAGFVTGGGWITSTPVDETTCKTCTFMRVGGKANFGFESKYEKGKNVPSGNTEFQFQAGGMNFKSSNYEWLVISGTKAQYKGTGTINGTGNYGFMLTAVDGDLGTNKTPDLFRIKIWDINNGSAIVYDNQYGALDSDPLNTQLGGGSIVIHDTKTATKTTTIALQSGREAIEDQSFSKLKIVAMPNPTTSQFTLQLQSNDKQQEMTVIVVNESGRIIEMKQHVTAGQTLQLGSTYRPGIYFVQVIQGGKKEQVQVMKVSN